MLNDAFIFSIADATMDGIVQAQGILRDDTKEYNPIQSLQAAGYGFLGGTVINVGTSFMKPLAKMTSSRKDFISGLKQLFEDHYIDVPDEKYDVLEAQSKKIEELEPIVQQAEEYKEKQRALLLADFSEEDRKDFEHLALPDLQKVHTKILKQKVVKTENSVSGFSQVPQKKMMEMDKKERRQNWQGILQSYKRKG